MALERGYICLYFDRFSVSMFDFRAVATIYILTQVLRILEEEARDRSEDTWADGTGGRGAVAVEEIAHGHIAIGG